MYLFIDFLTRYSQLYEKKRSYLYKCISSSVLLFYVILYVLRLTKQSRQSLSNKSILLLTRIRKTFANQLSLPLLYVYLCLLGIYILYTIYTTPWQQCILSRYYYLLSSRYYYNDMLYTYRLTLLGRAFAIMTWHSKI